MKNSRPRLTPVAIICSSIAIIGALVIPVVAIMEEKGLAFLYFLPPISLVGVVLGALAATRREGKFGLIFSSAVAICIILYVYAFTHPIIIGLSGM